jgi:UDP-2,4-diacetamido-2,4,6-trideoxy-beta-L-altropyranose hydrolase
MGVGHIMRCLTLADGLRKRGAKIIFVCRDLHGHLGSLVVEKGYILKLLPSPALDFTEQSNIWLKTLWDVDVNETIAALGPNIDLMIIDHYGINANWHRKISSITKKIMVIDDLANRVLHCDVLLDQTFGRNKSDYFTCVNPGTLMLCGTKYALLREQFSKNRECAITKRKSYRGIQKILISFGGADFNNNSAKMLDIIFDIDFKHNPKIEVVLGDSSLYLDEIRKQAKHSKLDVRIFPYVENMANLMLNADVAIGAGGSTSWERCTLALPTLLFVDADNQLLVAKNLENIGAVKVIDKTKACIEMTKNILLGLDNNIDKYTAMSQSASEVCDGLGAERVAEKLTNLISQIN